MGKSGKPSHAIYDPKEKFDENGNYPVEKYHDERGYYKKGNKAAVGRKSKTEWRLELNKAFRAAATKEKMLKILDVAYQKALKGDNQMITLFLERTLGKEENKIDVTHDTTITVCLPMMGQRRKEIESQIIENIESGTLNELPEYEGEEEND